MQWTGERPAAPRVLYRKCVHVAAATLVTASLCLMIAALLWPAWVQQTYLQGSLVMGIDACSSCIGMLKHWSWQCFKHLHCSVMENDSLCDIYNRSAKATILFCSMDFLAVVFNLMLMERYFAFLLGKDYGSPRMLRLLSVLVLSAHCTAVGTYFSLTQASFRDICTAALGPSDRAELCVQEGPIIAIAAGATQFLMVILVNRSFSLRVRARDQGVWVYSSRVYCLPIKVWMRLVFAMHLAIYLCAVIGILTVSWVTRDTHTEKWNGGLLRCDSCPFNSEESVYST